MEEYQLLPGNTARDHLALELERILDRLFVFTGEQHDIDLSNYTAVLINFKHIVEFGNQISLSKIIEAALRARKAMILLNVHDGKLMSQLLGIGAQGKCVLVRPGQQYNMIHVLGLYESELTNGCAQAEVTQDAEGNSCFYPKNGAICGENATYDHPVTFEKLRVAQKARVIESVDFRF